jgi:peroxiredoxin
MRTALISLFSLGLVAGLVIPATLAATAPEGAKIGQAAPAFTLQSDQGKNVSLSDFPDKIVVLEWTNPGCPFVQRHYKEGTFVKLADKYKDKNVIWLAVNSTATATNESDHKWATDNHLSYPILNDSAGVVGQAYGAKTTPDLFIIDTHGKLAYMGGIDNDPDGTNAATRINYVDKALGELISGSTVTVPETKSYGCGVKYPNAK